MIAGKAATLANCQWINVIRQPWKRKLETQGSQFRADGRQQSQNKPNSHDILGVNKISQKRTKQTQASYQPYYRLLTAILGPIFDSFEWMACSPSGIWEKISG
jgi:hypothetical protein